MYAAKDRFQLRQLEAGKTRFIPCHPDDCEKEIKAAHTAGAYYREKGWIAHRIYTVTVQDGLENSGILIGLKKGHSNE